MKSLAERQDGFAQAVVGLAQCPDGLEVPPGVDASGRFDVYRNNVAVGLIEALRTTFPVVERLVGTDFFRAMARSYAREDLPRSPVLLEYGEGFPAYIAAFEPAAELAYLPDVAVLEWHWVRAYHAMDAEPLTLRALHRFVAERIPELRLDLHPSASILSFASPALSIWSRHQNEETPSMADLTYASEAVLIWRDDVYVRVLSLEPGELRFLRAVRDGQSVGGAAAFTYADVPAARLSELIRTLFEGSLFTGARMEGST
ncbi:hypothetical protein BJI69_19910 [Luteibacter rhizovicinus DSM 16549]|uniref:Uncharacterized protein n=1 Tax=Luteibacter rhizovicinus DSM 16549 TaxID=1440763 RepID=A0A0G9HHF1_9GAMM|nr:DUF2063 domain-containing protein [Luteibacter rhizovicinus]APG05943.1 hypothetical protein BJI69_19910 [Luteibacter rhizovicinus DSM 16549]KLD67107.1 hypothetical protein Y883_09075 [Luteibacter rhizovicinus DSM 16549]